MNHTKKLLCLLMIFALVFSASMLPAQAQPNEKTPVILVPGFSSSALFLREAGEPEQRVWGLSPDELLSLIVENIVKSGLLPGAQDGGRVQMIGDAVGRQFMSVAGDLACNPDGTSVLPVEPYSNDPAKTSVDYLDAYDPSLIHMPALAYSLAERVGAENVFNFHVDFRQGAIACAKNLRAYVEEVKQYTGSNQVSIFALSHGGQVAGAYLSLFGTKGDLRNVVLNVPALGGAALAYDVLSGNINLNVQSLIAFVETGKLSESQFSWLSQEGSFDTLNAVVRACLPHIYNVIGYWGSIWDFIPREYYEQLKADRLNARACAELIAKSDQMHHAVVPGFAQSFYECQNAGVRLSIVAASGLASVTGLQENSDAIIPTESATGARCAPFGKRFADGYAGMGAQCADLSHNHISPSMEINAAQGYLPENTWFIDGQFHGQSFWDPYSRVLIETLLLADAPMDIYADPAFPQFHASTNPRDGVFVCFDQSREGYLSGEDTSLIVTNLSETYPLRLVSVLAKGMDVHFSALTAGELQPGESATLRLRGKLPETSRTHAAVTVNYYQSGTLSLLKSRTFDFTIMNGPAPEYNPSSPFAEAEFPDTLHEILNEKTDRLLTKLRLKELFSIVYNTVQDLTKRFSSPK
ncbi:MAG: hypothetical protein LBS36_07480 [Oscillospiraceae bacterium]|nr:hypothetical protein [Oscillospiraceae bacterium]